MGLLWKLVVWGVLLAITIGLSVAFGPVGFIIGFVAVLGAVGQLQEAGAKQAA